MKKTLPLIAVLLVFLVGVGVLTYPLISSMVNNSQARRSGVEYKEKAEKFNNEELDALLAEAEKYNESLHKVILTDPFDEESYNLIGQNYTEALWMDDNGLIGYVEIPKIDVYLPIYHGTSLEVLSMGAGHLEHTSLPIGGEGTHSVISAHSAWPGQTFFDYLETLGEGDEFYIHVLNMTLKYEVDQIKVVLPEDTKDLYIVDGEDYVTLLTCTPYSVNTHRLLVRGTRVPYSEKEEVKQPSNVRFDEGSLYLLGLKLSYTTVILSIVGFLLFVGVVVFLSVRLRQKNRKRAKKDGDGSA